VQQVLLVILVQLVLTQQSLDLQDLRVRLVLKVTKVLESKFLVHTTQLKNLKQLSQQETQVRGT
jgi:hypothetical protein